MKPIIKNILGIRNRFLQRNVSNTFCILPWIHIYSNPDGSVLPCCISDYRMPLGNIQTNTIDDVWNNEKYKTLRKNMLTGKECNECSACYKSEKNGNISLRQSKLDDFAKFISLSKKTNLDGSLDNLNLKYFDIRWSNICNFKCRTCSSTYSSSWAAEDNTQGYQKEVFIYAGGKNNDDLYKQFLPHFHKIEEIYFAGGEPLLTDKHYDILEYLISIKKRNIRLRYNTNLSNLKYKDKNLIELWKKFSDVIVYVSLDSWGSRAEYIREGTKWQTIEENLQRLKFEVPHVQLQTSTVISAFNVNTLPEFLKYITDNGFFNKVKLETNFYNIINPNYYSVKILPDKLREETINKLSTAQITPYIDFQIKTVVNLLTNTTYDESLNQKFKEITIHYDKIRNRNFVETFPELLTMF
jgi:radical SAM protein with 4Fe4S-binding SPASM domain